MKKSKKLLALILVLAMALTFVPFAAANEAEEFDDYDKITQKEAVSVLAGIDVIRGLPDGSFGFDKTITRAEAAIIIARLVLGPAIADILPPGVSGFVDVDGNTGYGWASGAIAYCASEGYVIGVGGNRFNPGGELNAVQFAIMLLRVLGYDKNGELSGNNYAINAIALAGRIGLFAGVTADWMAGAPRNDIARYAFNALDIPMVNYSKDIDDYVRIVIDDSTTPVTYRTIASEGFDNLKVARNKADIFGRPSTVWSIGDDDIASFPNTPAFKTTKEVKNEDVLKGLGLSATLTIAAGDYYRDGPVAGIFTIPNDGVQLTGSGKGVQTEVYKVVDDYWLVIINTYLAVVDSVTAATADAARKVKLDVFPGADAAPVSRELETNSFAEDDVLLVTLTGALATSVIRSAKLADAVTNVAVSSFSSNSNVVFGGTSREYAARAVYDVEIRGNGDSRDGDSDVYSFNNTYNFFLDDYGYVLGNEVYSEAVTVLNYLYVVDAKVTLGVSGTFGSAAEAKVEVVYMDGSSEVKDVNILSAGSSSIEYAGGAFSGANSGHQYIRIPNADGTGAADGTNSNFYAGGGTAPGGANNLQVTNLKDRLFSFTVTDDGKLNLSAVRRVGNTVATLVADAEAADIEFERGNPRIGLASLFANSTTTLVSRNGGNVTTYTGIANFPDWEVTGTNIPMVYVANGTSITDVLVVGASYGGPGATPDGYAVWTGDLRSVSGGTEYRLFVNGSYDWYLMDTAPGASKTVVYEFFYNESTKKASVGAPSDGTAEIVISRVDAGARFIVASPTSLDLIIEFVADAKVYNISGSTWAAAAIGDLRAGQEIICVLNDKGVALAIFIVPEGTI